MLEGIIVRGAAGLGMLVTAVLLVTGAGARAGEGAGSEDRRERFREAVEAAGGEVDAAALYRALDAEVLDSLAGGGPFARAGFIQERLDGFAEAWGGGRFEILSVAPAGAVRALGVFVLATPAPGGSVRVYGDRAGRPTVVEVLEAPGVPEVTRWAAGAGHWVVAWWGPPSGRTRRALRVEVRRVEADGFGRRWTLDAAPVEASALAVERDRLVVRRAARYPGWKPGCEGQTEHEDTFRLARDGRIVPAGRRVLEGWHAELGAAAHGLFAALAAGDRRVLGQVVPDAVVRRRLPATLAPDDACEVAADGGRAANMAAVEVTTAGRRPWALEWRRATAGWRLTAASPVLQ